MNQILSRNKLKKKKKEAKLKNVNLCYLKGHHQILISNPLKSIHTLMFILVVKLRFKENV